MNVKVKICGVRSVESAKVAASIGADFIGLNFVSSSRRRIDSEKAREIIHVVKGTVKVVGVFQNAFLGYINDLVRYLELDFVQLHGEENPEFTKQVQSKVIKAFPVSKKTTAGQLISTMNEFSADYFLLDRTIQGEGEMIDSTQAKIVAEKFPIFLAGGLTSDNISELVAKINPYGVDVAGGIETNGVEDLGKIKKFIKNAKGEIL